MRPQGEAGSSRPGKAISSRFSDRLGKNIEFARALVGTNQRAAASVRKTFWLQIIFMIINNYTFYLIWWVLFQNFQQLRGWSLVHVTILFGIVSAAFGLAVVFGGGVINLSRMISQGDLDSYLTQPKSLLLFILNSHSVVAGWGDVFTGISFLLLSDMLNGWNALIALATILCGGLLFVMSGVIIHSLAFWLGKTQTLSKQLFEFVITFSLYPQHIFTGPVKLLLFTAIPAGFIGYVPVQLMTQFSWSNLLALFSFTLLYSFCAVSIFHLGLKRYESGNRFH